MQHVFTLQIMATNAISSMVALFIIIRKRGKVDKKLNSTQPTNQPIARMIIQITRQDCWYTKPSLALGLHPANNIYTFTCIRITELQSTIHFCPLPLVIFNSYRRYARNTVHTAICILIRTSADYTTKTPENINYGLYSHYHRYYAVSNRQISSNNNITLALITRHI